MYFRGGSCKLVTVEQSDMQVRVAFVSNPDSGSHRIFETCEWVFRLLRQNCMMNYRTYLQIWQARIFSGRVCSILHAKEVFPVPPLPVKIRALCLLSLSETNWSKAWNAHPLVDASNSFALNQIKRAWTSASGANIDLSPRILEGRCVDSLLEMACAMFLLSRKSALSISSMPVMAVLRLTITFRSSLSLSPRKFPNVTLVRSCFLLMNSSGETRFNVETRASALLLPFRNLKKKTGWSSKRFGQSWN